MLLVQGAHNKLGSCSNFGMLHFQLARLLSWSQIVAGCPFDLLSDDTYTL